MKRAYYPYSNARRPLLRGARGDALVGLTMCAVGLAFVILDVLVRLL